MVRRGECLRLRRRPRRRALRACRHDSERCRHTGRGRLADCDPRGRPGLCRGAAARCPRGSPPPRIPVRQCEAIEQTIGELVGPLARRAVAPAEGFRTVRVDDPQQRCRAPQDRGRDRPASRGSGRDGIPRRGRGVRARTSVVARAAQPPSVAPAQRSYWRSRSSTCELVSEMAPAGVPRVGAPAPAGASDEALPEPGPSSSGLSAPSRSRRRIIA